MRLYSLFVNIQNSVQEIISNGLFLFIVNAYNKLIHKVNQNEKSLTID